jgi:hypothetical protein
MFLPLKKNHFCQRVEKERFVRLLAGPIGQQLTHLALPGITQAEDPDCWYAYTEQGTRTLQPPPRLQPPPPTNEVH